MRICSRVESCGCLGSGTADGRRTFPARSISFCSTPEIGQGELQRLLAATRAELGHAMGIQAAPIFHRIVRWEKAIPQYHLGHLERIAWITARLSLHPGLFVTGNAFHGVAMNDCTGQAVEIAQKVQAFLDRHDS